MSKIMIVEDEMAIREMVSMALEDAGYQALVASSATEALQVLEQQTPNLILLDWMMPGMSGIDLARKLRRQEKTANIPIIMLTARTQEDDKVKGLDVGADDYVTKPFSTKELIARIKAVLRRSQGEPIGDVIKSGGIALDMTSRRVSANEQEVEMGPTEFRLLHYFITHPERVFSRAQLLDKVWGDNVYVEERTVDVHIRRLRKALSPTGLDNRIQTVRSVGYRFSDKDQ